MSRGRRGPGIDSDPNMIGLTRVPARKTPLPRTLGGLCVCPGVGTRFSVGGTPVCPNVGGTVTTLLSDNAVADRTTGHTATVAQGVGATVQARVVVSLASSVAPTSFRLTFQYLDSIAVTIRGWNGSAWVPCALSFGAIADGGGVLNWWDINVSGNGQAFQCFLFTFVDTVVGDTQAPYINITDVRLYNGATLLN